MKTSMTKKLALSLVSACCLGLAALPAAAGPLLPGQSDSLTVYDRAGNVIAQTIATEADEVANGNGFIFIIPTAGLINPAMFGNATTIFEDLTNPSGFSDIFGIANGVSGCLDTTGLCLAFSSDINGVPPPFFGTFPNNLYESNGIFNATYLLSVSLIDQGYTAEFRSDAVVPEPGSLALLGLGFAVMVARRRKLAAED